MNDLTGRRTRRLKVISSGKFVQPDDLRELEPNQATVTLSIPIELMRLCKSPLAQFVNKMGMEPIMVDGSIIITDAADRTLIENEIYVFEFPVNKENNFAGLIVKRVLEIYDHGVMLGSDRPGEPEYFIENQALKVMGRIKVIGLPTDKPGKYTWSAVSNETKYVQ